MLAKGLEKTWTEALTYKLRCFWLRLKGCKPYVSGYSVKHLYKLGDRVEKGGEVKAIIFCGRWSFDQNKYPGMASESQWQVWVKETFWS